MKNTLKNISIISFWLIIWWLVSFFVSNHILLVGPVETFARLADLAGSTGFWLSILNSLERIVYGFSLALVFGIIIATFAGRFKLFHMVVMPFFGVIKSIPVASFTIIAIFWVGSSNLSVFIAFVTVVPIIFFNTYQGIVDTDPQLLEMAHVFKISAYKKVRYIYLRTVAPYVISSVKSGFGFAWKAGIAAELIGVAPDTIGFNLHMSRVFLQTADLFAWTFTIVILCYVIEKLMLYAFARFYD